MTFIFGFAALSVDMGYIYSARAEMQAAADAAALAGTGTLLTDERLKGTYELETVFNSARGAAENYTAANHVLGQSLAIDWNSNNAPDGGIVVGYLADPTDRTSPLNFTNPFQFNTVQIRLRCDDTENNPITLGFANIFGISSADLFATATATAEDGIVGFEIPPSGNNPQVLPFALHETAWANLLSQGVAEDNDNYAYDSDTGTVSEGSDWLPELNLYPGAGTGQLPPGNFGTVDIGSNNNSTADISRQILYGISAEDLAYFGGELRLGPDGTLSLNGDTGLSAAVKDELEAIKGEPRAIPIFSQVTGPGNNSQYTITGFVGIRIVYVKLTGAMKKKCVVIQPAVLVDEGAIADSGNSYFVYRPITLCRLAGRHDNSNLPHLGVKGGHPGQNSVRDAAHPPSIT